MVVIPTIHSLFLFNDLQKIVAPPSKCSVFTLNELITQPLFIMFKSLKRAVGEILRCSSVSVRLKNVYIDLIDFSKLIRFPQQFFIAMFRFYTNLKAMEAQLKTPSAACDI